MGNKLIIHNDMAGIRKRMCIENLKSMETALQARLYYYYYYLCHAVWLMSSHHIETELNFH